MTALTIPAVGTLLWMLCHELTLAWRNVGARRMWFTIICGGVVWVFVHLGAWAMLNFEGAIDRSGIGARLIPLAGTAFWLLCSIMVSQTMAHAVSALFDRGDMDLLLSSPLSTSAIFAVRGLAIAVAAGLLPTLLLLPFAHVGLVMGKANLMAIYPVSAALGLFTAAIGLLTTMSLVKLFGTRRAKTLTQILAACIGAAFFLLTQAQQLLSRQQAAALASWTKRETELGGWFATDSLLWWPVRAMLGEPLPLAAILLIAVVGFCLVVKLTHARFVRGTQESMLGGQSRAARHADSRTGKFRTGLVPIILMKEWKLLARDPQIISQTLMQLLYLVPLIFVGFNRSSGTILLIPGFVMLTAMLAGNLAWLTIAAEDAPELVGTAPVSRNRVRWLKALAAMTPSMLLVLPMAIYWLTRDAYASAVLLFCATGGTFCAALCHIWNPRQGKRHDMKKRYREDRLTNILEALGSMGWAGVAVCMSGYWLWLPLALAGVLMGPGAAWLLGRSARADDAPD